MHLSVVLSDSCLLSVLTASGHLWLLTPPGFQAMKWPISTELSTQIGLMKDTVSVLLCVMMCTGIILYAHRTPQQRPPQQWPPQPHAPHFTGFLASYHLNMEWVELQSLPWQPEVGVSVL